MELPSEAARRSRSVPLAAAGCIALAAALGIVREAGMDPGERAVSGPLGSLALFGAIAAPAIVALVAVGRAPVLLIGAGAVLVPLAFLSLAGAALPLLAPAVLFVAAGARAEPRVAAVDVIGAALVGALVLLATVCLFAHQDPAVWATATGGGGTSDVITTAEALTSLACSTAAIFTAWFHVHER